MQFLYPGLALTIAILASGFALLTGQSGAVVYFLPAPHASSSESVRLGVYVDAGRPINVVSGRITFPKDIVSVSVEESPDALIDLWLEAPKVASGEVRFSGGTSKKLDTVDEALLFYVLVTRTKDGYVELDVTDLQTLERDGRGSPLSVTSRSYVVFAEPTTGSAVGGSGSASTPVATQADFTGDGMVAIDDLSILLSRLFGTYEATYDLNRDGSVGLGDLSTFFTVYGR